MKIKQLTVKNYRNYDNLTLDFSANLNIFLGENAQGKTNLLESIYVLAMSRSHRTNNEKELIRWQQPFAKISGLIEKSVGDTELEMTISQKGKKGKVNYLEQARLSDYIGSLNVILFAPEDLAIVKGTPQVRRRFLDMEMGQVYPFYLHQLSAYQTTLKQRNLYLKKIQQTKKKDQTYLDILNEQLADYGSSVILQRFLFIKKLARWANEIHRRISFSKEDLALLYKNSVQDVVETDDQQTIKQKFLVHLNKNQSKDLMQTTTSIGPHRDDLLFLVNQRDVQTYGSQGQQRTTALSIKLAEIELMKDEVGEYPLLLLDDVLSELDDERQIHLLTFIEEKLQTFITTTNVSHIIEQLSVQPDIFYIKAGQVERSRDTE